MVQVLCRPIRTEVFGQRRTKAQRNATSPFIRVTGGATSWPEASMPGSKRPKAARPSMEPKADTRSPARARGGQLSADGHTCTSDPPEVCDVESGEIGLDYRPKCLREPPGSLNTHPLADAALMIDCATTSRSTPSARGWGVAGAFGLAGKQFTIPPDVSTPPTNYPVFPQPDDPKVWVWRYMDFPRLVSWLTTNALVLTRLDLLDDKREGRHGKHFRQLIFQSALRQMQAQQNPATHAERKHLATHQAEEALAQAERNRAASFVSCWCMGHRESEAMWRIYGGSGASVALVLPYERLRDSLKGSSCLIGKVTYFDFNTLVVPPGNVYRGTMHKSYEYDYEKEIRVIEHVPSIWSGDKVPPGVPSISDPPRVRGVPWVIAEHVERIVISPYAAPWQAEAIRAIVSRLSPGLEARIIESEMT
jgi:hypothetical protein